METEKREYQVEMVVMVSCVHGTYMQYNQYGSKTCTHWLTKCGCSFKKMDLIGKKWSTKIPKIGPKTLKK